MAEKTKNEEPQEVVTESGNTEAGAPVANASPERQAEPPMVEAKGNREAAKYRTQLRDAEQQLEASQAALTASRDQLLKIAVKHFRFGTTRFETLNSPSFREEAFDDVEFEHDKLFTDTGLLDHEALAQKLAEVYEAKPHYFQLARGPYVPNEGLSPDNRGRGNGFQEAFRPKR